MKESIWVCRSGKSACYLSSFLNERKIFVPWEGYNIDLTTVESREEIKELVRKEKNVSNPITVSNWAGMLFSFIHQMKKGDYVLIPEYKSRFYILGKIQSDYKYERENLELHHSREIDIIEKHIPRSVFPQSIQYSLGAFRSIFRLKQVDEIIDSISTWDNQTKGNE